MQQQRFFTPVASYKTKTKRNAQDLSPPKTKPFPKNILSQPEKVEVAAADAAIVQSAHPVASNRTRTKNL
jgi:hypothetical protein